ncbi:MAG TPA: flagellar export chaperone FliS [Mycobacteriales bacterium]|nr:flagellar export chaperone FliS [Mycobacteriales bacterium]
MDPHDRYLEERVFTASAAELTGMLFDAAVASVRLGITQAEAGAWLQAVPRWIKAQRIVTELRTALRGDDPEAAYLAGTLDRLYVWVNEELVRTSSGRDLAAARNALGVLEGLATSWRSSCLAPASVVA